MKVFQCLGLLLLVGARSAAFVVNTGLRHPGESQSLSTPIVQEHSTSLHVGVSYGPPSGEQQLSMLLRRNNRMDGVNSQQQFFDVDPSFSSAFVIARDVKAEQEDLQRRKLTLSVAASTAVVCAAFMAKQLASSGALPYLFSQIPHFYKAFPLQASIATCGLNSAVADTISQVQSCKPSEGLIDFKWRQHFSSLFYGTTCLGIGTNLVYTKLLPALLAGTSGLTTVLGSAMLDNFVFAPLIWLPPAYAIKAAFHGQSIKEALQKYIHDVRTGSLLQRYASFWMPAQIINFAMVPKHLRVVSTAGFSFIWFLILTKITSEKK